MFFAVSHKKFFGDSAFYSLNNLINDLSGLGDLQHTVGTHFSFSHNTYSLRHISVNLTETGKAIVYCLLSPKSEIAIPQVEDDTELRNRNSEICYKMMVSAF